MVNSILVYLINGLPSCVDHKEVYDLSPPMKNTGEKENILKETAVNSTGGRQESQILVSGDVGPICGDVIMSGGVLFSLHVLT